MKTISDMRKIISSEVRKINKEFGVKLKYDSWEKEYALPSGLGDDVENRILNSLQKNLSEHGVSLYARSTLQKKIRVGFRLDT